MANTILTNDMIYKLTLLNLSNSLGTVKACNRNYESKYIKGIGSSVRIGNPVMYRGRTTNTIVNFEDTVETETTLTIDQTAGADTTFTQQQLSRDVTDFSENYIKPITIKIANLCNAGVMSAINTGFYNSVGNSTTPVSGFNPVDNLVTRMQEMAIDGDEWFLGLTPASKAGIRQGNLNLFTPATNEKIVMKGSLGMYDGLQLYMDQQMVQHTSGSLAGTPLVAAIPTDGTTSISLKGFTNSAAGVLKAGDLISFANVYAVNRLTYEVYPYLAQFNVQANVDADGSGNAVATVYPAFNLANNYQNINSLPQINAAVTLANAAASTTFTKNIGFTKRAITFAAPPQEPNPGAVFSKSMTEPKTGIAIAMNVAYTINTNTNLYRWDVYYATKAFGDYGSYLFALR